MKIYKYLFILGCIFCLTFCSCKKVVEIEAPPTFISSDNVFANDATAISVVTGLYTRISSGQLLSPGSILGISLSSGLSADELGLLGGSSNSNGRLVRFYTNRLQNLSTETFWETLYQYLQTVNLTLEGLSKTTTLTPAVKKQLEGEAKFMRAFGHFYLVNFYGDVPLVMTSDYRANAVLLRTPKANVYQQIISDLKEAQQLLSNSYLSNTLLGNSNERIRPTSWAATALLARVYLFTGDWANAEAQASLIINNSSLFALSTLNGAFLKASLGNKEAIWQLQPVNSGWNTEDAVTFVLNAAPNSSKPVFLSSHLISAFEVGDNRRSSWIRDTTFNSVAYSYPYKYKNAVSGLAVDEYHMVFRVAEQFLIRAEARAKQNNLTGAIDDLDTIRQRANLSLISVSNPTIGQSALLDVILHERQVELFTEWGHRWLDLKRTGKVDAVMSVVTPQKGGTWNTNWQLYPIPSGDIIANPGIAQNPGYN